jgi:hypothetical protein
MCLIITGCAVSATNSTGSRRRRVGTVRMRGGKRRPANCIVAIRKFDSALLNALRTIPEA